MIDWSATHAALLAAVAAGGPLPDVASELAQDISVVGKIYDRVWASHPVAGDTVLIEATGHIAWRAALSDSIEKLHELAATVDGEPVPSIDPAGNLKADWVTGHRRDQSSWRICCTYPIARARRQATRGAPEVRPYLLRSP